MLAAAATRFPCGKFPGISFRAVSSATSSQSHYEVLGVAQAATITEIKAAFRKRAKQLHPDTQRPGTRHEQPSQASRAAFAKLFIAYQVLRDDNKRRLYDLSQDDAASRVLRRAAAAAAASPAGPEQSAHSPVRPHPQEELQLRWGLHGYAVSLADRVAHSGTGRLGRYWGNYRDGSQHDLHSALLHAYFGPRLNVGKHQLPEAFEGEERSEPGVGDLLHLVSGRTLLGVIRERRNPVLPGAKPAQTGLSGEASRQRLHPSSGFTSCSTDECQEAGHPAHQTKWLAAERRVSKPRSDDARVYSSASFTSLDERPRPAAAAVQAGLGTQPPDQEPLVLEMLLEGRVMAIGVLTPSHLPDGQTSPHGWWHEGERPTLRIYSGEGHLMSRETGGLMFLGSGADAAHGTRYSVVRYTTPFVRHLTFLAENGPKYVAVGRAMRARLPPSAWWLFPPRCATHSCGGWYFEWPGHQHQHHPLWLPPEVMVLTAAFASLEQEADRVLRRQRWSRRRWWSSWLSMAGAYRRFRAWFQ